MPFLIAIRAFLGKLPWQVWLALALIATHAFAYHSGYDSARDKYRRQMAELTASVEAAQEQARAAQIAVNQAEQERLDNLAERIDHEAAQTRIAVADATAAFIDRNRVRTDAGSVASGTDIPASGDGAGERSELPPGLVLVTELDVQRCGEWQAYGVNAHEWAVSLGDAAGTAQR